MKKTKLNRIKNILSKEGWEESKLDDKFYDLSFKKGTFHLMVKYQGGFVDIHISKFNKSIVGVYKFRNLDVDKAVSNLIKDIA